MGRNRKSRALGSQLSRRSLLRGGVEAAGLLGFTFINQTFLPGIARAAVRSLAGADGFGDLRSPDHNGLMLPPGFSSRIVAISHEFVGSTSYRWHPNPDGGATFATKDGGWIYVSNQESFLGSGGASAIRFAKGGRIVDAYSILGGTDRNCAGAPTPWGAWLSCEEVPEGRVYECDPHTAVTPGEPGRVLPGLGTFRHEAAAVDSVRKQVYLTEDQPDGLLYRATPDHYPDLRSGGLEALEVLDPKHQGRIRPGQKRGLAWHEVPEPNPINGGIQIAQHAAVDRRATRYQVPMATVFNGGEGCWIQGHRVYFTCKGEQRVMVIDTETDEIEVLYDLATSAMPELADMDNIFVGPGGDVYVAEDPGNLQIVALTRSGKVKPIVQLPGETQGLRHTEVTGPALSPDGSRLYLSSQRDPGITYEVTGPFLGGALARADWFRAMRGA